MEYKNYKSMIEYIHGSGYNNIVESGIDTDEDIGTPDVIEVHTVDEILGGLPEEKSTETYDNISNFLKQFSSSKRSEKLKKLKTGSGEDSDESSDDEPSEDSSLSVNPIESISDESSVKPTEIEGILILSDNPVMGNTENTENTEGANEDDDEDTLSESPIEHDPEEEEEESSESSDDEESEIIRKKKKVEQAEQADDEEHSELSVSPIDDEGSEEDGEVEEVGEVEGAEEVKDVEEEKDNIIHEGGSEKFMEAENILHKYEKYIK